LAEAEERGLLLTSADDTELSPDESELSECSSSELSSELELQESDSSLLPARLAPAAAATWSRARTWRFCWRCAWWFLRLTGERSAGPFLAAESPAAELEAETRPDTEPFRLPPSACR
jgi:hypothetical protein